MATWLNLHVAALVLSALVFGGMTFFMALFAPLVFRHLPRETAAAFMRALFPVYFLVMGVVSLVPALALFPIAAYRGEATALAVVAALFFAARFLLLPALNRSRDAGQDGRAASLHRTSVLIHLLQWLIVAVVLVRLAA